MSLTCRDFTHQQAHVKCSLMQLSLWVDIPHFWRLFPSTVMLGSQFYKLGWLVTDYTPTTFRPTHHARAWYQIVLVRWRSYLVLSSSSWTFQWWGGRYFVKGLSTLLWARGYLRFLLPLPLTSCICGLSLYKIILPTCFNLTFPCKKDNSTNFCVVGSSKFSSFSMNNW